MRPRLTPLVAALALLVPGVTALSAGVLGAPVAGASQISVLRAKASAIGQKVDVLNTRLEILAEEFDQASNRKASLQRAIAADAKSLHRAQSSVRADTVTLNRQAVAAYVGAGSAGGLSAALSSNPNAIPLQQTYLAVASGSLDTALSTLQGSEHQLNVQAATLGAAEHQATLTTATLGAARDQAGTLEGQLTATLAGVQGSLAGAVAQQELAQQRQAAAVAASQAVQARAASPQQSVALASSPVASGGSAAGADAVKAAESQLGVPYQWAGASPGSGFDCSGLAMWAWGQAGVSLPHSAQAQYDSIEHVPFSELQPGDLVFYASGGYIYHVVMYVGNGQAVQAMDTGTVISITALPGGAYGAGRP